MHANAALVRGFLTDVVVDGDTDAVDAKRTIPPADDTSISGGEAIPIGPFELQIAAKLHLGTQTDVEDASIYR